MAVEVKWFATLAKRTRSRRSQMRVPFSRGLTPMKIFLDEGFRDDDADHVTMFVNNVHAAPNHSLHDGDRVEYMVVIRGAGRSA